MYLRTPTKELRELEVCLVQYGTWYTDFGHMEFGRPKLKQWKKKETSELTRHLSFWKYMFFLFYQKLNKKWINMDLFSGSFKLENVQRVLTPQNLSCSIKEQFNYFERWYVKMIRFLKSCFVSVLALFVPPSFFQVNIHSVQYS